MATRQRITSVWSHHSSRSWALSFTFSQAQAHTSLSFALPPILLNGQKTKWDLLSYSLQPLKHFTIWFHWWLELWKVREASCSAQQLSLHVVIVCITRTSDWGNWSCNGPSTFLSLQQTCWLGNDGPSSTRVSLFMCLHTPCLRLFFEPFFFFYARAYRCQLYNLLSLDGFFVCLTGVYECVIHATF